MRPFWMNGLMLFCAFMAFIYVPWDLFIKPVAEDQEVWFGYMFTGWGAKAAEIPHWFVYGAGFWGFLKMKSWLHPWAAVYIFQVAFSMVAWGFFNTDTSSLIPSAIVASLFVILAVSLWRARARFDQ